jgi:hypothetical protein
MDSPDPYNTALPPDLRKYFWDVSFEELTIEKYSRFIAERILNYGDMDSLRWLLTWTDRKFILKLLEDSRNLNRKTRNFWDIVLNGSGTDLH